MSSFARFDSIKRPVACFCALVAITVALSPQRLFGGVPLVLNSYGWDKVYRLDSSSVSGIATLLPPVNIASTAFLHATDAAGDGRVYGVAGSNLWRIDVSTPIANWQKIVALDDSGSDGLAWSPLGQLFVAKLNVVRQVDPVTGVTVPGTTISLSNGSPLNMEGIDFDAQGTLYAADPSHLYTVNRTTGAASLLYTAPDSSHGVFTDIDFGSDGLIRALTFSNYLLTYDPKTNTGAWSPWKFTYNGNSFSAS